MPFTPDGIYWKRDGIEDAPALVLLNSIGTDMDLWEPVLPHLLPVSKDLLPLHAGLFIGATVALVVILVAGHIAMALLDRRTEPDERDRSIELRAGSYGSFVLATGVFLALCAAVLTEGNAIMAHVLLGFWVLAQGVDIVCQLVLHHRGS